MKPGKRRRAGSFSMAVVLAMAIVGAMGGKNQDGATPAGPAGNASGSAPADQTLTVGFVYVGPKDDYGYNQAHHEGALVVSKLPGVKIREEENVPETDAVQKTMES